MVRKKILLIIALVSINGLLHAMENKIQLPSAKVLKTRLGFDDFVEITMLDAHLGGKNLSPLEVTTMLEEHLVEYDNYVQDSFVSKIMQLSKKGLLQRILQNSIVECEELIKQLLEKKAAQ